ncbi:hypothetical protein ORIO_15675 [Cereibacter azotoformans]|uniref:Uncharacterized protein n=1 Tax=Cereibacter sphaeroides (strain ATCC 17025 / ATH 2.4.3) TaxID=349102 RepID=A4WZ57_CERS5|nr:MULTISPECIES: hypothetical protein [Cereibacter]ULB11322.1 hypothetical protein ORIO_15675 [Cereibacter azotoformans]
MEEDGFARAVWRAARRSAATLVASLWRGLSSEEVEARIAARPPRDQAAIVAGVLAALFLTSTLFAQAGVVGFLIFLLLVVVLVR